MIYPIVMVFITQSITVVIVWEKYTYFHKVTSIVHVSGRFPVIVSIAAICGNQALLSSLVKLILKIYNYFKILISSRLFQALSQWGRRERKSHPKSWRGRKKRKRKQAPLPLLSPVSSRFIFVFNCAFSIQRTRLSRSPEQATSASSALHER